MELRISQLVADDDLTDSQVLTVTIAAVNDAPIAGLGLSNY